MTLEKTVYMNQLLSYYGTLLTDKQASVMQAYYEADYSLAEIAENLQISRQAVHDTIRRSEEALNHYENQLQLKKKSDQRWQALEDLTQLLQGHEQALHLVHQLIELEQ
ncbi:YlxM family DNA-binding protein [Facklamia languida]